MLYSLSRSRDGGSLKEDTEISLSQESVGLGGCSAGPGLEEVWELGAPV